jgi:hypothetical protein
MDTMPSQDQLVAMIGSPPTAQGVASAIIAATTAPATPDAAPDGHGLDPSDPAVTQVPRDETVPTPGVDLPVTDPTPPAPPPVPGGGAPSSDGAAGSSTPDPVPADDPLADAVTADETQLANDEAAVSADKAKLATDQAALAAENPTS